jgi:hypothetical protein
VGQSLSQGAKLKMVDRFLWEDLENYMNGTNFGAVFFYGKSYVLILEKSRLDDFFPNSSGHPVGF